VHQAIIRTSDVGEGSTVWLKNAAGKEQQIWKSFRPVVCHWHPSGRFLALEDPVARISTAVVVFEVGADGSELVYQTPYSDSEYVLSFQFSKWTEGANGIEINVFDEDTHKVVYTYVEKLVKGRPKAHPNIYSSGD
jgi:hypothetical protein